MQLKYVHSLVAVMYRKMTSFPIILNFPKSSEDAPLSSIHLTCDLWKHHCACIEDTQFLILNKKWYVTAISDLTQKYIYNTSTYCTQN